MSLQPGWVDAYALAVKNSEREKVTGAKPRKNNPIDRAKLRESAAKGGRKGGVSRARMHRERKEANEVG